ncbi:MAG TPA: hypothetical protein VG755_28005 [Nannocystaceae bacterium]|nr:hypothetical protein [Nannocystaceae bacterium]
MSVVIDVVISVVIDVVMSVVIVADVVFVVDDSEPVSLFVVLVPSSSAGQPASERAKAGRVSQASVLDIGNLLRLVQGGRSAG